MSDDHRDDQDCPPDVEPRRTDGESCVPDDGEAEQSGWVDSVRRDRPVLYAARHMIKPVVQLVVGVVGIGAVLRAPFDGPELLSPEEVASLVAQYEQGVPVRELADRYNVHRTTVTEHARRHGLLLRRRSLDEDERARSARLYEDGLSMSELAGRFGVSTGAVRTALVAEGVAIRKRGPRARLAATSTG